MPDRPAEVYPHYVPLGRGGSASKKLVARRVLAPKAQRKQERPSGLYPQRRSALQPDQSLLPTVGGHRAEPVIVASARQQKELRVRMQVGEPFGVPNGDEGIFLATHYYDLTCVVLERVDRIEGVMQHPSHWKQP